ncbi:hypothetical protein EXS74_02740 [Candidatus Woesearchaeota archaeon]|nr:hypothetical protein [Candidatus Woesearchaeota archaeon]
MDKKGQEHQFFFAFEAVLGILVAGILISVSANFDSLSNVNKIYAQEDLKVLVETLQASPGNIHYDYQLKTLYDVNIEKDKVTVTKSDGLLDGYTYYNLSLTKEQGSEQITEEKHV